MKISELEMLLKEHREKHGDVDISFGKVDYESNSYCNCDVEIDFDSIENEINITVM